MLQKMLPRNNFTKNCQWKNMQKIVFFLLILLCFAKTVQAGGQWIGTAGGWYWLNAYGQTDGVIYGAQWVNGCWVYNPVGQLPPIIQPQIQPQVQPQVQQQPQVQPQIQQQGQGQSQQSSYTPETLPSNWQVEMLREASKQAEFLRFQQMADKLGLKGFYGMESPNGNMNIQNMYSQNNGSSYGSKVDLPVQQGNSVYGSYDPTYNTFAEPQRIPDFSVAINGLVSLAAQQQTSSSRLSSELTNTIQAAVESSRLLSETQIRSQTLNVMQAQRSQQESNYQAFVTEFMRANKNSTLQVTTSANGETRMSIIPGSQYSGGQYSGGQAEYPPSGYEGGPGASYEGGSGGYSGDTSASIDRDTAVSLAETMRANCLSCHGGENTNSNSGRLRLGSGTQLDLTRLTNQQWGRIFEKVADGSMPLGGKLSTTQKGHFQRAERFLKAGSKAKATPAPKTGLPEAKQYELEPIEPQQKEGVPPRPPGADGPVGPGNGSMLKRQN